jgi:hypothetical protein
MRKLAALASGGGRVVAVGRLPERGVGLNGGQQASEIAELAKGFQLVRDEDEAERILREAGLRDFTAAGRDAAETAQATVPLIGETAFRALHRKAGDADYYFVANGDRVARELEVSFRDARGRAAQVWDPLTGEVRPWQGPKLALGPWGSAVVVFGLGTAAPSTQPAWSEPRAIDGPWHFRTEGTSTHEAVWTKLPDWREVPELKSFAGLGIYSHDIVVPAGATRARICLGRVEQSAEVRVNAGAGDVTFLPPYCVDAAVRAGANRLEVRVANTWSNAVAAMPPQPSVAPGPGYGVTDVLYGNTARPPQPGGLLGPVTVEFR